MECSSTFSPRPDQVPFLTFAINGQAVPSATSCSETTGTGYGLAAVRLTDYGASAGAPVTVSADLETEPTRGGPVPDNAVARLRVGVRVPFTDVPLPPRPNPLAPLDRVFCSTVGALTTYLLGPNTRSITVPNRPPGATLDIRAQSQTPGLLHIRANGRSLSDSGWYDYDGRCSFMSADPATIGAGPVTISVDPEYTTGDWYVLVAVSEHPE